MKPQDDDNAIVFGRTGQETTDEKLHREIFRKAERKAKRRKRLYPLVKPFKKLWEQRVVFVIGVLVGLTVALIRHLLGF